MTPARGANGNTARAGVLPFGKNRNKPLSQVPGDYLRWLLVNVRLGSGLRREIVADLDRRDRERAAAEAQVAAPMPTAPPRDVMGFWLNEIEAGLFVEACLAGELVITPDMPVSSPVPRAWKAHCEAARKPYRVRELTLADVGAEPPKGHP